MSKGNNAQTYSRRQNFVYNQVQNTHKIITGYTNLSPHQIKGYTRFTQKEKLPFLHKDIAFEQQELRQSTAQYSTHAHF
jgi:hypothetical protein